MEVSREMQKKEQEEMRERIRRFDNEYVSYGDGMQKMAAYLFEVVAVIIMMLPYQIYAEEPAMLFMLGITMPFPARFYLQAYLSLSENKKTRSLYGKIKYAPVNIRELRRVRVEYLVRFLGKTIPYAFGAQILWVLIIYHKIMAANLLYVFLAAGVWPFLANYALICQDTKSKY